MLDPILHHKFIQLQVNDKRNYFESSDHLTMFLETYYIVTGLNEEWEGCQHMFLSINFKNPHASFSFLFLTADRRTTHSHYNLNILSVITCMKLFLSNSTSHCELRSQIDWTCARDSFNT
jgi:hypothetical protein